jgi:hypothetical protein
LKSEKERIRWHGSFAFSGGGEEEHVQRRGRMVWEKNEYPSVARILGMWP